MNKKLVIGVVALILILSIGLAGCGNKNQEENNPTSESSSEESSMPESGAEENSIPESDTEESNMSESDTEASDTLESGMSVSAMVMEDFNRILSGDQQMSAEEIAQALCDNPNLVIGPVTMPVEEGLLNGFGNTQILGFKDGATFAPMIGAIPFLGYVFVLEEDTDVESFMNTLKDNADLRWNVCTTADEMVVSHAGQTVLFVMCPVTFEE